MRRNSFLTNFLGVALWTLLICEVVAFGAGGQARVSYTVKVADIEQQVLHVVTRVENIHQPYVDLSLPIWIPGLYKSENYAKNILRFQISDAKGNRVARRMTDRQTWRVETKGLDQFVVEFDYHANVLAIDQAVVMKDYAFFTGIQLFLKVGENNGGESRVKFEVPAGWSIVSALKETTDPTTFVAADYDTLVDAPAIVGKFDTTKFEVNGKPHYLVTTPAGAYKPADLERTTTMLGKVVTAQAAVFGGLPYDKYVYFYFAPQPDWAEERSIGGLNSQVNFLPPKIPIMSGYVSYTSAHEFFHLWNAKRIRPSVSWSLDYSHMSTSPLLWMVEGFTNYFSRVSRYHAGIDNRDRLLFGLGEIISGVRSDPAREYSSPADTSVFSWADYDHGKQPTFKPSALFQGEMIAVTLDVMMRRDSVGATGLEDVMRVLYVDYFKKGKGFTTEDLISIINHLTKRDYTDFFNRYVWGVENPPVDEALARVGYQYEDFSIQIPYMGFRLEQTPEGPKVNEVVAGSESAEAGVAVGDILVAFDDLSAQAGLASVRERLTSKIGQIVKLTIKRGGENKVLSVKVGVREESKHAITDLQKVTPEQLKVRDLWLRKV